MSQKTKQERRDVDQLLIQAVVLLQRQHLLAEHLIAEGALTLAEFEHAIMQGRQSIDNVLAVFNYCWALVDQLERYRKIAAVVPRLNQKGAEFRAFETALRPLTGIRNQFQHINNHIRNDNSGPLLGSVCWMNNNAQFIASLPDLGPTRSVPGIYLDTKTGAFGSQLCYVYNDDFYDLGNAVEGMRVFQSFVDAFGQINLDGVAFDQRKHFIAMRLDFTLTSSSSTPTNGGSAA
jgi:hypothetical protein